MMPASAAAADSRNCCNDFVKLVLREVVHGLNYLAVILEQYA
jgi:hypothetical protein